MQTSDFIVLLARQRSGTNPLRSVLETHPKIACTEEVLNVEPTPDYELEVETNYFRFLDKRLEGDLLRFLSLEHQEALFLDYLEYLRAFYDKQYLVVDVKYNSVHHLEGAWRFLTEEPALFRFIKTHGLRVINLTRRNFLRYYVSELKAQASRIWDVFDEEVVGDKPWFMRQFVETGRARARYEDRNIEIEPRAMLEALDLCRRENDVVSAAFADYSGYVTFDYQELFPRLGDPPSDAILTRITRWLGVDDDFGERKPQYKKQSDLPLPETIANWDEVAATLQGTDFEYCLADEAMYKASAETGSG